METLQRTANRGSISTGPYEVDNSIKLEVDNNEWLYRDAPTAGNRKTFTLSLWLKRAALGHIPAGGDEYLAGQGSNARYHFAGDTLRFQFESGSTELESSRVYRDPSAWYHIVLAVDTSQGTAANRVKLYINGVQEAWNNTEYPSLNQESDWMNTNDLYIGTKWASNSAGDGDNDLSGYLSEVVLLDGTAASPTSFGEVDDDSGIWSPIDVSGLTFGSQGFYLNFSNASSSGEDFSGNDNDLLDSNLSAADHSTDTPTNNFTTINPLFKYPGSQVISEGGAKVARSSGSGLNKTFISTIAVTAGKWYAEFKPTAGGSNYVVGIMPIDTASSVDMDANHLGNSSYTASLGYYSPDGSMLASGNSANGSFGASYTANDIIGVALDMTNRKVYFSKNGTYQNSQDPTNGTNAITLTDTSDGYHIGFTYDTSGTVECNFGGYTPSSISSAASDANGYGTFEYAPPTGYLALCTKNLGSDGG